MSEEYVLSIDQGTTSSRVLIFDRKANVKGSAYSEFTQYYPKPGWVEHDAAEIWNVTLGIINAVLEKSEIRASRLNAIGIANQRETTIMWDRNTGKPVARAIVWQDRRTAPFCDALKAKGLEEMIRSKTGLVIDAYFSGTKVKWLLDNVEGLRARASKREIAFGTIDSWLIWHLTGGKIHTTDYSNASRTLLFNIHDQKWDEELLDLFDIPASVLPDVQPSSCVYGQTDPERFFGTHGISVAGAAGDQQAALFGQAC
jgi:glycerol kinase